MVLVLFGFCVWAIVAEKIVSAIRYGYFPNRQWVQILDTNQTSCQGVLLWTGDRALVVMCPRGVRLVRPAETIVVATRERIRRAPVGLECSFRLVAECDSDALLESWGLPPTKNSRQLSRR
jgi:hypothetical protein